MVAPVIAELPSLEELQRARPGAGAFTEALGQLALQNDFFSLYLYVRDPADPSRVRARMFAPLSNIPEGLAESVAMRRAGRSPRSILALRGAAGRCGALWPRSPWSRVSWAPGHSPASR